MALDDDIALLSRAPLVGLLDRDALRLVAFAAESRTLRADEILFRKGDRSDGAYVVKAGAVALYPQDEGREAFTAEPGALIGRAALLVRTKRPATAVARAPSTLLRLAPSLVRRVLEEYPRAAETLHAALAVDLRGLMQQLAPIGDRLLRLNDAAPVPARERMA